MCMEIISKAPRRGARLAPGLELLLAVALAGLASAGCSSVGKPASPVLGHVEIPEVKIEAVRDTTAQVFHDEGFKVLSNGWTTLTFGTEGSAMDDLTYGNWMGKRIRVRAKVTITELSNGGCRLECSASRIRNEGEPVEDEIKIGKMHGHRYQMMLQEVAKRLQAPPVKPGKEPPG
jgi:hypothetical protein